MRVIASAFALAATVACSADYSTNPRRDVATIDVTIPLELEINQPATATAVERDQYGTPINGPAVTWSSSFRAVADVQPMTGEIFALRGGTTVITATVGSHVGQKTLTVSPPPILINEVNPNGDLPGGWVELFNPTPHAIDLTGWTISSNDLSAAFAFPAGVTIESGGYVAVNEATLPRGLNASDAVYLFSKYQAVSDQYRWSANQPGTSYGRCPDGQGGFVVLSSPTRKAINICP